MTKAMPPEDSQKELEEAVRILGEEYRDVIYAAWRIGYSDGKIAVNLQALGEKKDE